MKTALLDDIFPPRTIPVEVLSKTVRPSPYRKLVLLDGQGGYRTHDVPDEELLSARIGNDCMFVVSSSCFPNKCCPSDVAEAYGIVLAAMGCIPSDGTVLCVDGNCIETDVPSADMSDMLVWVYADDERIADAFPQKHPKDLLRFTYRGHVIWGGQVPSSYEKKCIDMENIRRYHLSLSRIHQILSSISRKTPSAWIFNEQHCSPKYDDSAIEKTLSQLGCGIFSYKFTQPTPLESRTPTQLERYLDDNVSFAKLHLDEDVIDTREPDYAVLQGIVELWREIAFANQSVELADIINRDLSKIDEQYGMESYVDALVSGVPIEDLLA